MIRTYVDSGVLIAAATERGPLVPEAVEILDDPERSFLSSLYVEIEVYPAARRNRRGQELEFYEQFFDKAEFPRSGDYERACKGALEILSKHPIGVVDALHVAMALELDADELVTTEKPRKGIASTGLLDVISLWG